MGKEVSIEKARELFPDCVVMGNVDPVTVQEGTPEQVRVLCKECIEAGKDHPGGYALMTGCEVPPHAPPVNVAQIGVVFDVYWLVRPSHADVVHGNHSVAAIHENRDHLSVQV